MPEAEIAQWIAPVARALCGYTQCLGHILRDQPIVGQCRLQADVGAWQHGIGDQEGVGRSLLVGCSQRVQPAPQLDHPPGLHPTGELAAYIGGINRTGQQKASLEDRLRRNISQQLIEFHTVIMP